MKRYILLSFDIEEFEMPREYGDPIPFSKQIEVSHQGATKILDLLKRHGAKATFYTTANFATNATDIVHRIINEGHELASHGYVHDHFEASHLKLSKDILEDISKTEVKGYRMARMQPVPEIEVFKAGYKYNSSINPTFLPGRYNNLNESRTHFMREGVLQLPASVTPLFRLPLFWITFHNLSLWQYTKFANWVIKKDGYLNIYFHPWEFMNIGPKEKYNFPSYITRNTDDDMVRRLGQFIDWGMQKGYQFTTTYNFIEEKSILKNANNTL